MFEHDEESEMQDPNKDMKIKLLDDLIEKIMSMDDGSAAEEKAESPMEEKAEMSPSGDDQEMKDKLAQLKGI